jgi:DNA-binding NtrC family response regulator
MVHRRKGVMIVDEEPSQRNKYFDVVKLTGVDVSSAMDGTEAISRLPREKSDVVIVNMYSKEVGGFSFIKELRTYGLGQKMKIIGVVKDSTNAPTGVRARGADDLMEPDVEPYELIELACRHLGISKIEIPKEQMKKRREIVEEVVKNYRHRAKESERAGGRALGVKVFLPGGKSPLLALTDDAGKKRTRR